MHFYSCLESYVKQGNESPIGRNARVQFQEETERWLKSKINGNSIEGITAPLPLRSSQVNYAGTVVGSRYLRVISTKVPVFGWHATNLAFGNWRRRCRDRGDNRCPKKNIEFGTEILSRTRTKVEQRIFAPSIRFQRWRREGFIGEMTFRLHKFSPLTYYSIDRNSRSRCYCKMSWFLFTHLFTDGKIRGNKINSIKVLDLSRFDHELTSRL